MSVSILLFDPEGEFSARFNRAMKFSKSLYVFQTEHQLSRVEQLIDNTTFDMLVFYTPRFTEHQYFVLERCQRELQVAVVLIIKDIFDVPDVALELKKNGLCEVFGLPREPHAWQHFLSRLAAIGKAHEKESNTLVRKPHRDNVKKDDSESDFFYVRSTGWTMRLSNTRPELILVLARNFDTQVEEMIRTVSGKFTIPTVLLFREQFEQKKAIEGLSVLDEVSTLPMTEKLESKKIYVANTRAHLSVNSMGRFEKDTLTPPCYGFKPAAVQLAASAVDVLGAKMIVVTMGALDEDFNAAIRLVKYAGGVCIVGTEAGTSAGDGTQVVQVPVKDVPVRLGQVINESNEVLTV